MAKTKLSMQLLKDAGIPRKFRLLDLDTFEGDKDALDQCRHYVAHFSGAFRHGAGMLLCGAPQTFKTFLACLVLKSLMAKGWTCRYMTFHQVVEAYEAKTLENMIGEDVSCLVIDDVGPKFSLAKFALAQAITVRSDIGLPYIICSEFTDPRQWDSEYSKKIRMRLTSDLIEVNCGDSSVSLRSQAMSDSRKEAIVRKYHA